MSLYYGVKDMAKLAIYKKSDNSLFAYFPFGNSMTISITGDSVEATANGSTIITWQANRKGTAQLETQVISPKLLAIVLGATSTTGSGTIAQYESGTVGTSSPTYTLAETPSTASLSVFLTEADGATVKTELTAVVSSPTDVQYSITGKVITVSSGNAGKNILCIYTKDETTIETTTIKSNEFAQAFKLVGLGKVKDVLGVERLQQIELFNATAQSNMDLTYSSTEASTFSFTFDLAQDPATNKMVEFKTL